MMENYKILLLFAIFIAVQITDGVSTSGNEMKLEDVQENCYRLISNFRIDCTSKCPETFPVGRCLRLHGKWRCLCGTGDNIHKLITPKEAGQMAKVCNSQRDKKHEGCRKLCLKQSFHGYCGEIRGVWQCICVHNENAVEKYTWKEAKFMRGVCNSELQDNSACGKLCPVGFLGLCKELVDRFECYCELNEPYRKMRILHSVRDAETMFETCNSKVQNDAKCTALCPPYFEFGSCVKENGIWGCRCSQRYFEHDLYSISDAKRISETCPKDEFNNDCSDLCPIGLNGNCVEIGVDIKTCGCMGLTPGKGWYTVRKAKEMTDVCNYNNHDTDEANIACTKLCPQKDGGFSHGICVYEGNICECLCKHANAEGGDNWLTLKNALVFALGKRLREKRIE